MTPSPWLSVLIPVYNVEAYLRECVESVAGQADEGVEIILVEDVSTDGSRALLLALQQQHLGRFRLLQHQTNQGLSSARNTMLQASSGRYLWFFDSDDVMLPGAIAELRTIVERDAPDLVLCDFLMLRERTRLKHRLRGELHRRTFAGPSGRLETDPGQLLCGLLEQGQLHIWSKIARREVWGELRFPVGRFFEDMHVTPRLALRARSYYHAPSVWVAYRQRAGSILASMSDTKIEDLSGALLGFRDEFLASPAGASAQARFALSYFAAKNFINTGRHLLRQRIPDRHHLLALYRERLLQSLPLTLAEFRAAYLKRSWFWRWLRLAWYLRQAEAPQR